MKKYEELSKNEKKELKTEYKTSEFAKFFNFYKIYATLSVIFFSLACFTDFFENANVFISLLVLIVYFTFGEFIYYKEKKLVKFYYKLKNNNK